MVSYRNSLIGIDEIDNHHKILFDIIYEIYRNIIEKGSNIDKQLLKLVAYSSRHFKIEEEYLLSKCTSENKNYINKHISEHAEFLCNLKNEIEEYIFEDKNVIIDLALFLNRWIKHHMMEDAKICSIIKK